MLRAYPECSAQDQVRVAELVPAVAAGEGGGVGALDQPAATNRLEHEQVAGVGLVPAGDQAVDGPHAALRGDDEAGPTRAGLDAPVRPGHRLERAHDGGADR